MKALFPLLISLLLLDPHPLSAEDAEGLIDYTKLDHTISLESLRAGNHDAKGNNEYLFSVSLHGMVISKEEREKGFEKRNKISLDQGTFAPKPLKPLSQWEPSDPRPNVKISGDTVRQLTADVMRQYNVSEARVSILVEIKMLEKNKKYFVLNDDRLIGTTHYYVIPETMPHAPEAKNQKLTISDDLGTLVSIKVEYNNRETKPNPNPEKQPTPAAPAR